MGSRSQNEKKFKAWIGLPNGGRRYRLEIRGRSGWRAVYFKKVDPAEKTVRFWQEIYDEKGMLVAVHERFPMDKGHRKV